MAESTPALKIAHIITSLKIGGAERMTIDLAAFQISQGLNSTIISLGGSRDMLVSVCTEKDIPVKTLNPNRWLRQLQLLIHITQYQVLHVHSPAVMRTISKLLPLFKSKHIIYTRHGAATIDRPKWRHIHIKIAPYVDQLTFVSDEALANFSRMPIWDRVPKTVIANGVNIDEMAAISRKPMASSVTINLGVVGRLVELKNHIVLLKALASLNKQQRCCFSLHVFGDGPCGKELASFSTQYLTDMHIEFHSPIIERERIYPHFDILVVTSITEGLSMAIIEAMASARPVIASRVGGNPTLVKPGITGWLFENNDIQELANILIDISTNRQLINHLGRLSQQQIKQNYPLSDTANHYAVLYKAALPDPKDRN